MPVFFQQQKTNKLNNMHEKINHKSVHVIANSEQDKQRASERRNYRMQMVNVWK